MVQEHPSMATSGLGKVAKERDEGVMRPPELPSPSSPHLGIPAVRGPGASLRCLLRILPSETQITFLSASIALPTCAM
ncbi:hypothetical protein BP6252_12229 [Coleophoma cylindrospora]|uniref:Uncharacterized protein n=1 Tax=Coleophoma cylindrospora TaxID=1849047 RepID=A0A3D8QG66_9HELO|nr:hypothetical protein BP6252_12229 [Coleophoma cylindrospora]